MATRQETIDSRLKDLAQFHKEHPEFDFETLAAPFKQRINFEFDVKVFNILARAFSLDLHSLQVVPPSLSSVHHLKAAVRSTQTEHAELTHLFRFIGNRRR